MSDIPSSSLAPAELVNVSSFREAAQEKMSRMAFGYYDAGADAEHSLEDNKQAFQRIKLLPRVLRDVTHIDLGLTLFGHRLRSPILIAPTAMHRLACDDGEVATARAAKKAGTLMCLSSLTTTTPEDVAKAADGAPLWFQLYVCKRRETTLSFVRRVEKAGFTALVVTVDTPVLGHRERDVQNSFHLPAGMKLEMFADEDKFTLELEKLNSGLSVFVQSQFDQSLQWTDIAWLRTVTDLPILVKGIHNPLDAELAVRAGVSGIIVSNHGARQLDTVPATIDMLPAVVRVVRGRVPVLLDGGVRRGTDVLKALALGASAVLLGRPILWGLAHGGEDGVTRVLDILNEGLERALCLCGVCSIGQLRAEADELLVGVGACRVARL